MTDLVQISTETTGLYPISLTDDVSAALAANAVVSLSISGGKDSIVSAAATNAYLDTIGHAGPRVLIHSDLGASEWLDSLPSCQRLADRLNLELIVVRRKQGDMLARWQQRWHDNCQRYINLSCVCLIQPWATKGMRFCTSEMKVAPITRELSVRWPGKQIVSVTGIRRAESPDRAKAPTCAPWKKPPRKVIGLNWHPIDQWSTPDVFRYIAEHNLPLHEAYTRYKSSRVSCTACILQSDGDSRAAATCPENLPFMKALVDLEIESGFSFKQSGYLGDIIADVLSPETLNALAAAKVKAERRRKIESLLPKSLLYVKGWPMAVPTEAEASILSNVREEMGYLFNLPVRFTYAGSVIEHYERLMALKVTRDKKKSKRSM